MLSMFEKVKKKKKDIKRKNTHSKAKPLVKKKKERTPLTHLKFIRTI